MWGRATQRDGVALAKKIDLAEKVKDAEISLVELRSPEDELNYNILRALYHLGKKSRDPDGFWVSAGQVCQWCEVNEFEADPVAVGHRLKAFGFKNNRKTMSGVYRWVLRKRLMDLIEAFNLGETPKEVDGEKYDSMKATVFRIYLDDGEIEDLSISTEIIQQATKEFNKMGEEKAREWLDKYG